MSIANIRRDYSGDPLSETESDPDPFAQFARWFEQVRDLEADPTAFALATSTRDGRPSVRAVLLKGVKDVLLGELPPGSTGPFVVGTLAAAGSGLIAISALLGYVRRHDYSIFVWYRLTAATIVLLLIATGVRTAGF